MNKLALLCLILTVILILSACSVRTDDDALSETVSDLSGTEPDMPETVSSEEAYNIEDAQSPEDTALEESEETVIPIDDVNPESTETSSEVKSDDDTTAVSPVTDDPETTAPLQPDAVQQIAVESISLSINKKQIFKGDTVEPTVTVVPSNADDLSYTLVSDDENVLREINGKWTGVGGGTAELTVTSSNGITVTLSVTVTVSVEGIELDVNEKTMNRGETLRLNPAVSPSDASDKTVTYKSDNQNVVTVSDSGTIYAVGAGTVTVTCTASNGFQTSCKITVVVPVESVSVKVSQSKVNKGSEFEVTVEIYPADATDKSFSVSSSDENILRQSGDKWLACGAGTAKITAAASNGVTGGAEISVIVEVEAVEFDENQITINRYDRAALNATVFPSDATDKTLIYKTDNPNVVAVSNDGTIYASGAGTAIITCTASNGIETSCEITVIVPVTAIYVELDRYRYKIGETAVFNVKIYPDDATDKSYSVSLAGSGGALSGDNAVMCVSGGTETITVTASNGISGKKDIDIIDLDAYASEVTRLTNIERADYNLSILSESNSLLKSASMIRAKEIITEFSHTRPDGSRCFTVFDDIGLNYGTCGENIAYGYQNPEDVVNGWMNSEGHRENILNGNFSYIGIGVEMDSMGTLYWTQMFLG